MLKKKNYIITILGQKIIFFYSISHPHGSVIESSADRWSIKVVYYFAWAFDLYYKTEHNFPFYFIYLFMLLQCDALGELEINLVSWPSSPPTWLYHFAFILPFFSTVYLFCFFFYLELCFHCVIFLPSKIFFKINFKS